ncbi:MAG: AbiH family protein [Eubacteriales bacterium]
MNLTFILGNGFDINLGLKTSFQDFYEYYKEIECSTDSISEKRNFVEYVESIKSFDNWSDLEMTFGRHSVNVKTPIEYHQCQKDIEVELTKYIQKEYLNFPILTEELDLSLFGELFERILSTLKPVDIRTLKNAPLSGRLKCAFLTLNYTNSLEEILSQYQPAEDELPIEVHHIHGKLADNDIVFGVDNLSQIENKDIFSELPNHSVDFIKPERTGYLGLGEDSACESIILESNIIYIYGSSIGDTDNKWWSLVLERLVFAPQTFLIIDIYSSKVTDDSSLGDKKTLEVEYIEKVINKSLRDFSKNIQVKKEYDNPEFISHLTSRILITINKNIFSPIKNIVEKPLEVPTEAEVLEFIGIQ